MKTAKTIILLLARVIQIACILVLLACFYQGDLHLDIDSETFYKLELWSSFWLVCTIFFFMGRGGRWQIELASRKKCPPASVSMS